MVEKQQDKTAAPETVSPLATDKSYGEKVYHFVFNSLFNFWVNLFAAAAFTQWMARYHGSVRLPFTQTPRTPHVIQENIATWVAEKIMPGFKFLVSDKSPKGLKVAANKVTETLMLQVPGHLTIVPSIWLGAKIKPAFVKYFNRKHYGEAAEDDPTLVYRQQLVEAEAKPTLLGAVTGRIASLSLSFLFTTAVGSGNNKITTFGKNHKMDLLGKFPGVNDMAGRIGEGFGDGLVKAMPALEGTNARITKYYNTDRGVQDFFRFSAMDVAYTWILSAGIHPIMHLLRKVPGMTYATHAPVDRTVTSKAGDSTMLHAPQNRMADAVETPSRAKDDAARPTSHIRTEGMQHHETFRQNHQQELTA